MPPPTVHRIEDIKLIEKPSPYIVTAGEYSHYIGICDDYKYAGQEDFETEEEIFSRSTLTKEDSCSFAVYGLPTHKWLNMESDIEGMVSYIEKLRTQLNAAYKQLVDRYRISNKSTDEVKEQLQ